MALNVPDAVERIGVACIIYDVITKYDCIYLFVYYEPCKQWLNRKSAHAGRRLTAYIAPLENTSRQYRAEENIIL